MKKRKLTVDERHELAEKYMPTPEQIAAECAAIQDGWGEIERRRRSAPERPVDMTTVFRVVDDE